MNRESLIKQGLNYWSLIHDPLIVPLVLLCMSGLPVALIRTQTTTEVNEIACLSLR